MCVFRVRKRQKCVHCGRTWHGKDPEGNTKYLATARKLDFWLARAALWLPTMVSELKRSSGPKTIWKIVRNHYLVDTISAVAAPY